MKEEIRAFLEENKKTGGIKDDEDLFKKGYVNSLFALQLVIFLEATFKIRIKNKDITEDNFRTINNICETVSRLKGE